MGWKFDHKKIEAEIEKVKKTLNAASGSLFDPEQASEEQLRLMEELKNNNDKLNENIMDDIKRLGLSIQAELRDIQGEYKDEVSLLNEVSGRFFQSIPEYQVM